VVEKQDDAKDVEASTTDQRRKTPDCLQNAHFQLTPIPGMPPSAPEIPQTKEGENSGETPTRNVLGTFYGGTDIVEIQVISALEAQKSL
jgi:hypothetical protein